MPRDAALIALVDALPRPTLLTDDQSRLMASNPLARELLGGSPIAATRLESLFVQDPPVPDGRARTLSLASLPDHRVRCQVRTVRGEGALRFLVELESLDGPGPPLHGSPPSSPSALDETARFHRVLVELRQHLRRASPAEICTCLDLVAERARDALEIDTVGAWFFAPADPPALTCFHASETFDAQPTLHNAEIPGLVATIMRDEVVSCADAHADDRLRGLTNRWLAARDVCAIMSAPIIVRGETPIGTVLFESRRAHRWTPAQRMFAMGVSQLATMASDLVAHQRVEQALTTRQSILERVTTTLPAILYQYVHGEGRPEYPYIAGRTQELFGVSAEQLAAEPERIVEAVVPEDRYLIAEALAASDKTGRPFEVTVRARTADGRLRWIHAHSMPDEQDGRIVWNGIMTDITHVKRLESDLRQAQKMEAIGQLAGGIAHDFNNLLMIINGSSEMLLETLPGDHVCYPLVEVIRRSGLRGAALTRRLLTFGRKQPCSPTQMDLNHTVAQTHSILPRLMGAHICCTLRLGAVPGVIEADPIQIEQVLLNLAVNARDAMPDGGTLTIATERVTIEAFGDTPSALEPGTTYIVLRVTDTGTGMDAHTQARIFEPFFTTKAADRGTGLGLATVYGAVKQNGGHLEVRSEPEHGTEFVLYLPALDAAASTVEPDTAPPPPQPSARADVPRARVLLVEDEPDVRQLLELQLVGEGYHVTTACDGQEALSMLERGPFELLVTDITMPGISGIELARQVAERQPSVRVLYMSGYLSPKPTLMDGAEFLLKPFSSTELRAALQRTHRSPS